MRTPELARALGFGAVVAGCFRDAPLDSPPSNHAEAAPSDDVLAYLPADSELVFGLDLARKRSSPLWARFEPYVADAMKAELDKIRASCGFDPMQTVQRVTFGFRSHVRNELSGVAVVRGVDTSRILVCAADQFGKHGDGVTDRGVVILDPRSPKASAWTVAGSDTLVVQVGPHVDHDSITAIVTSGVPLRSSAIFLSLFGRLEPGASLWGVVNGASSALDGFDVRPRTIDGTVRTTDRVTVAVRIKVADPQGALKLADLIEKDLTKAPFLTLRAAVAAAETVKIDIVMTPDQISAALALIGIR